MTERRVTRALIGITALSYLIWQARIEGFSWPLAIGLPFAGLILALIYLVAAALVLVAKDRREDERLLLDAIVPMARETGYWVVVSYRPLPWPVAKWPWRWPWAAVHRVELKAGPPPPFTERDPC